MSTENRRTKPVFKTAAPDDQEKFKPLPPVTGTYPFHLQLNSVFADVQKDKLVFHLCGDTGGYNLPLIKHKVANAMIKQFYDEEILPEDRPQFFFHLGDVVYNFGQAEQYSNQFFDTYEHYPAPIFAIPGNHDADVDPLDPVKPNSLDAFIKVFCSDKPKVVEFSDNSKRLSNVQPNFYWTLQTPLANIIGLYSNVPRFGTITEPQKEWFIEELNAAAAERNEKALIVCLHHSAYSADVNHGSSLPMQIFLNSIFETTNIFPDIVFSGHVHNYQRFSKKYANGKVVPFVIAGAGGYADLHPVAKLNDPAFPDTSNLFDDVSLENYCDDTHGFLKISIEKTSERFVLNGQYYTIPAIGNESFETSVYDSFTINLGK